MPPRIKPFANEADSFQIGDLTIENRTDRVSVHGSIDLTRDKEGLEHARSLKALLDDVVALLEGADLPAHIEIIPPDEVKNPFA